MNEEYSPYKIVHHQDKLDILRDGGQPVPLQVQIVPSNVCNQRCVFCAYRMKDYLSNESFNEHEMLSYDKIKETLDCMVEMGIPAVQYTGGGEPLVHGRIYDIFKESLYKNLDCSLVTNGMALNNSLCELIGDFNWVRVSVDCSNAKTYSFLRNVSHNIFGKVIANINLLVMHKRKNTIGVGFVVEKENYKEIYDAAKLFKEMGVDNFRISAAFTPMGHKYFDSFFEEAKELAKKTEELSDDKFTVFNLFGDRIVDLFDGIQNYKFCPIKELMTYVGADYNVYTCCTLAYNARGLIGNIKENTFKEVWESQKKHYMFEKHDASKMCQHPCLYKGKNEFINYCLNPNPKHVNFI